MVFAVETPAQPPATAASPAITAAPVAPAAVESTVSAAALESTGPAAVVESTATVAAFSVMSAPVPTESAISWEQAQADAKAAGVEIMQLSLAQAMTLTLRNNLDVRVAGYQPQIDATQIDRQLSQFDPFVSAGAAYSTQHPPAIPVTSVTPNVPAPNNKPVTADVQQETKTTQVQGGMSVKTITGATASMGVSDTKTDSRSRSLFGTTVLQTEKFYEGALTFQLSQPLLKNAGVEFNKAGITIAQNNAKVSALTFENQIMDVLLNVDAAYWNLVFAREDYKAKEKSLQAAQDFLKNNEIKYEAGALAKIEVTRARAGVAARQQAIVVARAVIRDAEDRLRTFLDTPKYDVLSTAYLYPTDRPSVYAVEINVPESVHRALVLRPDIRQQLITLESIGIVVARAKNQLLPEVDLQATYLLNGVGDSWQGGFNDMMTLEGKGVTAGVTFAVPLGNRSARADMTAARYQRLQGLASLASLQRTATYGVKKTVRDASTSLQSIDASRVAVQAAQEEVEAEIQKFDVGQSTALDVLNAQNDLQTAESTYIASVVSFNISMANYYRQTGQILEEFGVRISAPDTIQCAKDSQVLFQ
jgi:outer membrane protein